jgi:deaminated glutathione amidase
MSAGNLQVAVVQMRSSDDPWENLLKVNDFVQEAQTRGASLVCFPENVFYRGPKKQESGWGRFEAHLSLTADGRIDPRTEFADQLKRFVEDWNIWVSLGSVMEEVAGSELPFNSHWMISPRGESVVSYKKVHLFDFKAPNGIVYRESAECAPGDRPVVVDIEGFRVGLSICFDLRFPELYREMALQEKAEVLLIPAAFTKTTGEAHWHALLKARAIENLAYVVAAGQSGAHFNAQGQSLECFGNSSVYSPWGECILSEALEGESIALVELRKETIEGCRGRLPALENARFFRKGRV